MKDPLREEYEGRINRVLDYIDRHLDDKHELETLARVAAFSPFHFHRVFSAIVGEPLAAYIRRARLERAARRLAANPRLSVTEVALEHGFSSPSTFARAFREHFGVTATEWRDDESKPCKAMSKERQADSNPGKEARFPDGYPPFESAHRTPLEPRRIDMHIEIKQLPARRVAYFRAMGPYDQSSEKAWGELCQWAGPRGLLGPHAAMIGVSHEDPLMTDAGRLRYDACVEVSAEVRAERNISIAEIPGGKYAVGRFDGTAEQIREAYSEIYGRWMSESGYQPGDSPCYEVYLNDPKRDGKFVMDVCVPVKPL
jgi:AraC family transcriptional regulator